jgi:hypothetical protein
MGFLHFGQSGGGVFLGMGTHAGSGASISHSLSPIIAEGGAVMNKA